MIRLILFIFLNLLSSTVVNGKKILLVEDLKVASSNVERYWALFNAHAKANELDCSVDYRGIDTLEIEIPKGAKHIPISSTADFQGVILKVLNKSLNTFLFEYTKPIKRIEVNKASIDNGNFITHPYLGKGDHMLFIVDSTAWVTIREGYSYGAYRKDCIIIKSGKAVNKPVLGYNNTLSRPICTVSSLTNERIDFCNLTFLRDSLCTRKTYLLKVSYSNNIHISHVNVVTPQNFSLYADHVFYIENCSNIHFNYCTINGTYSLHNKYGYAVLMDNVYDSYFSDFKAKANWGVFGTNNMNTVHLDRCELNRFDIHCYGKDVTCKNCKFTNGDNSFTSFYGTLYYSKCSFDDCTPVHIDASYKAYTPFNIVMHDCVYTLGDKRNYIIMGADLLNDSIKGRRKELSRHYWPSVSIDNLTIESNKSAVKDVYLFMLSRRWYERLLFAGDSFIIPANVRLNKIKITPHYGITFYETNLSTKTGMHFITSSVLITILLFAIILYLPIKIFEKRRDTDI